jgi:putative SOS response-associated peptidase YedK
VWPRPPLLRRQRDQARFPDSAGTADTEFCRQLERGADRLAAGRALWRQGPSAQPRGDALGARASLAKDIKVGFANINAKAEEIDTKPAFRDAFRQRRCLVPLDNFYEWKKTATGKQPHAIGLKGGGLMALAGLWETWRRRRANGCAASRSLQPTRMNCARRCITACPWFSRPETWPTWLGEEPANEVHLKALLAPYPPEEMVCWPVSPRVGYVKNNDPDLVQPIHLPWYGEFVARIGSA